MFINDQDHTIEDFLQAVNFVCPQGMSLKYFIVPYAANSPALVSGAGQYGFEPDSPIESNSQDVPGVTDTITYARKNYTDKQSFGDSNFNLNQIPNEFPITRKQNNPSNLEPMQTDLLAAGANIQSPVKGVKVLESTSNTRDILLKEAVGILPKTTLLHFEKCSLDESKWNVPFNTWSEPEVVGNTTLKRTPANQNFDYQYTYERPDRGTAYTRILKYISEHPFCKKSEMFNELFKNEQYRLRGKKRADGTIDWNGYMSGILQTLHHDGFFRVTTKHEYIPTQKCHDFVKEYNL